MPKQRTGTAVETAVFLLMSMLLDYLLSAASVTESSEWFVMLRTLSRFHQAGFDLEQIDVALSCSEPSFAKNILSVSIFL